jgi:hypothetical protein
VLNWRTQVDRVYSAPYGCYHNVSDREDIAMLIVKWAMSGELSTARLRRLAAHWNLDQEGLDRSALRLAVVNSPKNRAADGPAAYQAYEQIKTELF